MQKPKTLSKMCSNKIKPMKGNTATSITTNNTYLSM